MRFELGASLAFADGFIPAGQTGQGEHLHLAFVPEGEEHAVGVCVHEMLKNGAAAGDRLRQQVLRILSLDVEASGLDDTFQTHEPFDSPANGGGGSTKTPVNNGDPNKGGRPDGSKNAGTSKGSKP